MAALVACTLAAACSRFDAWPDLGLAMIYLDGREVTVDTSIRTDFTLDGQLLLGSMQGQYFLDGQLDEVSLWARVLTAAEMQRIYVRQQQQLGIFTSAVYDAGVVSRWQSLEVVSTRRVATAPPVASARHRPSVVSCARRRGQATPTRWPSRPHCVLTRAYTRNRLQARAATVTVRFP
jgi:hypothetical protein